MTRLESILARVLPSLPGPAALGEEIDSASAIVLGRILRLGLLSQGERASLRAMSFDADALAAAALAEVDQGASGRDAAESVLVLLGDLGAAEAEARVLAKARLVDAAQTDDTAFVTTDPWLLRLAAQNASTWWLDRIAPRPKVSLAMFDAPRATTLTLRRSATKAADLRIYAEVVGLEDDPALVAVERGTVIARMFDGEVEVRAIGLRIDEEDLPGGLCIRALDGHVEAVSLDGVAALESPAGYWVPIAPDRGAATLRVRFRDRDEDLPLDIVR